MPVVDDIELQNWLKNAPELRLDPSAPRTMAAARRLRRVEPSPDSECPCGKPHLEVVHHLEGSVYRTH